MPNPTTTYAWPPFVLAVPDDDARRQTPELTAVPENMAVLFWCGDGPGFAWPSNRVFARLLKAAVAHLLTEKHALADDLLGLDMDDIERWVKATRDLAARWPYGAQKRDLLVQVADSIEHTFVLRDYVRRDRWPTTAARIQGFRTGLAWWALNEFDRGLATVVGSRGGSPTIGRFTEALVEDGAIRLNLPEFADHELELEKALSGDSLSRRIRECGARLRPGAAVNVTAWVLRDLLFSPSADDCGRFSVRLGHPSTLAAASLH